VYSSRAPQPNPARAVCRLGGEPVIQLVAARASEQSRIQPDQAERAFLLARGTSKLPVPGLSVPACEERDCACRCRRCNGSGRPAHEQAEDREDHSATPKTAPWHRQQHGSEARSSNRAPQGSRRAFQAAGSCRVPVDAPRSSEDWHPYQVHGNGAMLEPWRRQTQAIPRDRPGWGICPSR
jgi:hypothetical protein